MSYHVEYYVVISTYQSQNLNLQNLLLDLPDQYLKTHFLHTSNTVHPSLLLRASLQIIFFEIVRIIFIDCLNDVM